MGDGDVALAILVGALIIGAVASAITYVIMYEDMADIGQLVCNEQYGAGTTEFTTKSTTFGITIVECEEVPQQEIKKFDGGYTKKTKALTTE